MGEEIKEEVKEEKSGATAEVNVDLSVSEKKTYNLTTILAIAMVLLAVACFCFGCDHGEKRMQSAAIKYGAGEFYADQTGKTHFRFISAKGEQSNVIGSATLTIEPILSLPPASSPVSGN